jgi:CheY-like chemotaxis protein
MVRLTVKEVLEAAGHEISIAVDGEGGLRQFQQQAVDFVLCDVFMPKMSGIAALKALRETSADIPVIMTSGAYQMPCIARPRPWIT